MKLIARKVFPPKTESPGFRSLPLPLVLALHCDND